jgi:hypothetical protein
MKLTEKLAAAERSYRRQRTALRSAAMVIGTILFALAVGLIAAWLA